MRSLILLLMLSLTSTYSFSTENKMSETHPRVKFETTAGDFIIELNPEKAPITVKNFLTYVNEGFYNGTVFHRIMPGFMAQGGGFDTSFKQKPTHDTIKIEADNGLTNDRGTVAMARTGIPDSASSQFFVNYKDNGFLNHTAKTSQGWGYAVFGKVVEGMDVVDSMADAPTGSRGGHQDVPKTDIVIEKAEVVQ
ncbi:MAG: peptidyl-prolyl cis-trans isomerase [Gammaproteobacteria bacterium]|jgi:peptidyl-prolyl cis-trans isomerase B (cyclophilin B)|nr:peptidylprolyl isomerase [Methyloprofundus sp.]MBT3811355.1 peptidyl-prolyl cis-trans isomerase [Gammaproteobacteria bacterium]HIL78373.1 peptidyl-prolyl cis-trans isomerase [Methylococcales bacterium]MBT4145961.1 peptidyl-prolyl cis-trans isomerase [Gammaproteobacteria bacterium]MBT5221650.1 peptidyl-prolyl cis-trans isomerase [Gammaproteobacteria bacterium]MBT5825046.1 peptidyl-prolyl cis-trans isomerase [Gammaproteobacteria bacterium]